MAPDGGQTGEEVSTVITCEGTLGHPEFPRQFQKVVERLNGLLGVPVKVRKLEPWNSVRVTLSVPREAALRLRQLAQQGAAQLRALGILSVQLDGEGAVSLRLQGANGEPQEVVLRTTQDGPSTSSSSLPLGLGALLPTASGAPGSSAASSQVQFKSPNVVCPPDSVVPRVGANMAAAQGAHTPNPLNKPPYAGPFPFASMNQAIHSQSNSSNSGPPSAPRSTNMEPPPPFLPPPYPGVRHSSSSSSQSPNQPPVTISSPLLVNLLQNDHQVGTTSVANSSTASMVTDLPPPPTPSVVRHMRPPPPPQPAKVTGLLPPSSPSSTVLSSSSSSPQAQSVKMTVNAHAPPLPGTPNHLTSQANMLVNSSNNNLSNSSVSNSSSVSSPSALSTSLASNTGQLMAANSPTMITSNQTQNQLNNSLVTSTQMAINSIANSLASAANSMTSGSSGGLGQSGMFGLSKSGFAQQSGGVGSQSSVQHYQRTPQGSIIAVNKPLPVANQMIGTPVQNSIPMHQVQRPNVTVAQTQSAHTLLRQQQPITSIPQQKTTPMFTQNQNTVVHPNQVKSLPGNQNNMMTINQNNMVSGSNVTLPGNSQTVSSNSHSTSNSHATSNSHTLPSNSHTASISSSHTLSGNSHSMLPQGSGRAASTSGMGRLLGHHQQQQQQNQPNLSNLGINISGLGPQQQHQPLHNNAGLGLSSVDALNTQVTQQIQQPSVTKSLPSPPPYSVAISRSWDSLVSNTPNLLDLAPSLTDLKPDDLDDILPTLGHDPLPELSELELLGGPSNSEGPSLDEESGNSNSNGSSSIGTAEPKIVASMENSTNAQDGRKFLINPLTGELEPHSGGESDAEEVKDVFTGLPSPLGLSDEDTSSTVRHDTATDQSDSETRSSNDGKHSRVKNSKGRREGRDSPALKPTEKIKLRLKLEKSEPINPAYKVDVSFINTQLPKKASTSVITPTMPSSNEELRVPPLHISLRGRNSVVIKNKTKLNPDGTPVVKKVRKMQNKGKKDGSEEEGSREGGEGANEHRKLKKFKGNYEHKDFLATLTDNPSSPNNAISKYSLHNHYKEKQKERRGSDSELVRANSRKHDANGALLGDEKRRRLSQSEGEKRMEDEAVPSVLGSTNVGTVGVLPQKIRKDKIKIKDSFKIKDSNRKLYSASKSSVPSPLDKQKQASVALPTAGDVDMEAKFKQSLMEGVMGEKGIPRPPHRTVEQVAHMVESVRVSVGEKVSKSPLDLSQKPVLPKEKSPEPDKCNVPESDRKSIDSLQEREKQLNAVVTSGGRSPNSGSSGGQGEDSGIESMDALSEKSPNQASQSPHADILPNVAVPTSKTQVPDMLDIEAQLAKMEGLDHHDTPAENKNRQNATNSPTKHSENVQKDRSPNRTTVEDVNENECIHRSDSKSCCDLTCTLQDGLSKGSGKRSQSGENEEDIVPLNTNKPDDQQSPNSPPSLRVAPALYTYPSNPGDKGGGGGGQNSRGGSESPSMTTEDEDSNLEPSTGGQTHVNNKGKSLLEQLLIEIPSEHHGSAATPSSHSPATRSSVRTRALSKLGSPELSSPVPKTPRTAPPVATAKRKRNESDSSNHSVEEARKRPRKGSEASEVGKKVVVQPISVNKKGAKGGNVTNQMEESSDSDEPLIEKLRKNPPKINTKVAKGAVTQQAPQATSASQINNKTNTRRSARAGHQQEKQEKQQEKQQPAQNTRSREKVVQQQQNHQQQQQVAHSNAEAEAALRRKTRSADVESKRKKEVK